MRERKERTLAGMVACCAVSVLALGGGNEMDWKNSILNGVSTPEDRTLLYSAGVMTIREATADKVDALSFWLSPTIQGKTQWGKIKEEFSAQQITDFFMGAIALTGPQSNDAAVWGLYNPWWDAVMFLYLKTNPEYVPEPSSRRARKAPIMIKDIRLVSGESLRREPIEPTDSEIARNTVMPTGEPLSPALWRVASGTKKAFQAMLPVDRATVSFEPVLSFVKALDMGHEWKRLQLRSVLRLKEASILLTDEKLRLEARDFRHLLVVGSAEKLDNTFNDDSAKVLLETYKEMPGMFRKDFVIYGAIKTPAGTQFLFINRRVPRLYATVTCVMDGGVRKCALEWYDLTQSEELYAAWQNRAERRDVR